MVLLYSEGMVAGYATSLFEFEVWRYALLQLSLCTCCSFILSPRYDEISPLFVSEWNAIL